MRLLLVIISFLIYGNLIHVDACHPHQSYKFSFSHLKHSNSAKPKHAFFSSIKQNQSSFQLKHQKKKHALRGFSRRISIFSVHSFRMNVEGYEISNSLFGEVSLHPSNFKDDYFHPPIKNDYFLS